MSGYQPQPFPESRPARLQQRNGGEIVDTADSEREPLAVGEKVGLVFMWVVSAVISVGGIDWIINNCFGA